MERSLTNGTSTDFLHPHSPPYHVRRLSPALTTDRPSSPGARRRRRQRKPWRKLLWVQHSFSKYHLTVGKTRLS